MIAEDDEDRSGPSGVVPFPFSRVRPAMSPDSLAVETYGTLAALIGVPIEQTTGHWCSRCHKIWFGYLLEVACPTCGNRHG